MKTFYFGDLLRTHDNRFKRNFYTDDSVVFRLKSKPDEKTSLAHHVRLGKRIVSEEGSGEAKVEKANYSISNGTTVKYSSSSEFSATAKLQNSEGSLELTYKPKAVNTEDQAFQLKGTAKYYPMHSGYDATVGVKYGSPQLGPIRLFTTLDFNFDNITKRLIKASLNSQIKDDYHLGVKFDHDLERFNNLVAQFTLKNPKGDVFLRADISKEEVVVGGCTHEKVSAFPPNYQFELHLDTTQQKKLLFSQPAYLIFGAAHKLSDSVSGKSKIEFKDQTYVQASMEHKFDRNWRFIMSESMVLDKLPFPDLSKAKYNFGVKLEYGF